MFRSILSSFVRSYGRQMGRTAARRTSWLVLPILLAVAVLGSLELLGVVNVSHLLGPAGVDVSGILHFFGR